MTNQAASPEQLERDIVQTRAAIDRKLAELQQHFAPRQIAMQAARSFGDQGGTFARNLATTLRDNPVPAVLLAVGLSWLMVAARSGRSAETASAPPQPATRGPARAEPLTPEPAAAPPTAAALAAAESSGQGTAAQAARGSAAAGRPAAERPAAERLAGERPAPESPVAAAKAGRR